MMLYGLYAKLTAVKKAPADSSGVYRLFISDLHQEMHDCLLDASVDTFAYFSLKAGFKELIASDMRVLERLISQAKKPQYPSLVFAFLNLARDANFEKLPSFSLAEHDKSKDMDISYYELKELQRTIGKQTAEQQGLINQDFENEYGQDCTKIRTKIVHETSWIDCLGSTMR
jgi:hypothetical protein